MGATWACTNFQEKIYNQAATMSTTNNPSRQLTPPNVHTATKRAVPTDVDPPGADDMSPVQQRPLFASNSAAAAPQDLFQPLSSDEESQEQLSRRPPPKVASITLPSIAASYSYAILP
jgi:hypothetical protein